MASYTYTALDKQGREQRGTVEAADAREAARALRQRAIIALEIQEAGAEDAGSDGTGGLGSLAGRLRPRQYMKVRAGDLVVFFRQIALMLRAGHTLVEALEACRDMVIKLRLRAAIGRMSEGIQQGSSFSAMVAGEKRIFTPMLARLIESGEHSGDLAPVLERLAESLEKRQDLKRQLATALTYPAFVLLASVGVIIFLVMVVIPRFATFLNAKKTGIPASTQALMDISDWFHDWGPMLGGTLLAGLFLGLAAYTTRPGKRAIDHAVLALPVVGKSVVYAAMAQLGWSLAMLLRSGVTALDSLRIASTTIGNLAIAEAFDRAADRILLGQSLSVALDQSRIPLMIRHMAAVGERSGQLDTVMQEVGEFYRKELEVLIKAMTAMVEPALIVMVGGMVGFVYYAFFQAVLKVSTGGM